MTRLICSVDDALLNQFPGYMRGVIWADQVINDESPYALTELLAEETFYQPLSVIRLDRHPRVTCWQEAYASLDGGEGTGMPSFTALVERVLKRRRLPLSTIVRDIAAILSLWHLVPVTACALDGLYEGLRLQFATGQELYSYCETSQDTSQHASKAGHPRSGELIMADGMRVVMSGWNRSQASDTHVTCATTAVALIIDALPIVQPAELRGICEEGVSLLETFCGASAQYAILKACAHAIMLD